MDSKRKQKTIVVSAVNLVEGGTLTILRDCLAYLSLLAQGGQYRVVALVHQQVLADFPNIEYMETQWPKKRWVNRLWFEYVSLKKISRQLGPVYLWFSLHDTTPNVIAERRAVYCHNPFPFYKWKWREWFFTPRIVAFALFSKYIYRKNIHLNQDVIVQQQWIKDAFKKLFPLQNSRIIVALPGELEPVDFPARPVNTDVFRFVYAASPNSHKNFECLAQAAQLLVNRGVCGFRVYITVKGQENAYAKWLKKNWGEVSALEFSGFMDRKALFGLYAQCHCLVFPSKVETWGLPITEFGIFGKPMLLADLPYAHETAAGYQQVGFFDPNRPDELADSMVRLIAKDTSFLTEVRQKPIEPPVSRSWHRLFELLLLKGNKDEDITNW